MSKGGIWQRGVIAAGVTLAAAGALATVGVAGTAAPADVYARDANGPCFSTVAVATDCAVGERADVAINTGEAVTWHFDGSTSNHNAAADNDVPADPDWVNYAGDFVNTGSYSRTFNQPGAYEYICQAHPGMKGTITVTGTPVTPTPSATVSPTATPSTQPGGGTPPPTGVTDGIKPTVSKVKLKALRRGARVTFTVSENATVTIRVKRGKKVVKTVKVQAVAGTRTVNLRSSKLKKGRYTIEVAARDAAGNSSTLAKKPLRLKK
jgi:plastocyanin